MLLKYLKYINFAGLDLVKRQAMHCHRVLRAIEDVTMKSTVLTRDTWETLLNFLLAANDSLLTPPSEKGTPLLSSIAHCIFYASCCILKS